MLEDDDPTNGTSKLKITAAQDWARIISDKSMALFIDSDHGTGTSGSNDNSDASFIIYKNQGCLCSESDAAELFKITNDGTAFVKDLWVKPLTNGAFSFPDYVFDKNYKLNKLTEVKKYINKNHHLPEVPSAKEVADNGGLSMSEMVTTLLKKVEENTLYLIEQDETIKKMQAENRELKTTIEKLTKK